MPDLIAVHGWPLLLAMAGAALLIGFAKTSFGGLASVAVAIFALAMPAKESTAATLVLLIVGDFVAVSRYRDVRWPLLWRLIPSVVPGLLLGAWFMTVVDDTVMRRTIGALLLVMVLLQLAQKVRREATVAGEQHPGWVRASLTGTAAGFATMTANSAGPVMVLYFLASRIDKARFIGTNAWFFLVVNLSKVPLTASLGLFTPQALLLDLALVPAVLIGTAVGAWAIHRVNQRQFEWVTLAASAVAAGSLLLR